MRPLSDLRVLAVTVFLAGPFLSMTLARLGADVIKVEIPGRGDPVRGNGPYAGPDGIHSEQRSEKHIATRFLKRSQGVKSVTLNLRTEKGPRAVPGNGQAVRRRAGKPGSRFHDPAGPGLRRRGGGEPRRHLRQHLRLRPDWALRGAAGPRPANPGHERPHGHQRRTRRPAHSRRFLHRRPGYAHVRVHRHPGRPAGEGTHWSKAHISTYP